MSEYISAQRQVFISPLTDGPWGTIILSTKLLKPAILQQEHGTEGPHGHNLASLSETDLAASRGPRTAQIVIDKRKILRDAQTGEGSVELCWGESSNKE